MPPTKASGLPARRAALRKVFSGVPGVDEITGGGLPRNRPVLVCGNTGSGKTVFAMQFLAAGAARGERGVFLSFDEAPEDLAVNFASLGIDVQRLVQRRLLHLEHFDVQRKDLAEVGEWDLEGLFVRARHASRSIGAKRMVIDTLETLFANFANEEVLRGEVSRLFRWLKRQGVTTVVTAESSGPALTRHGVEEFVADCVLRLGRTMRADISTRRIQVVKYRGSAHGSNEYPFLIDDKGISVVPITSLALDHPAPSDRIGTGVARLDAMLGGSGVFRGSSVLVTGTAGAGKSSLAGHFAAAACRRGERCILFAFEESEQQILRNQRSIGLDLERWCKRGLLSIVARRPTLAGLETHLVAISRAVEAAGPGMVVIDPITNLTAVGGVVEVRAMLTRLIDFLKSRRTTAVFTALVEDERAVATDLGVSSLMDTWISLTQADANGERNHLLAILKSRGGKHSNQIREFRLSDHGIDLLDVYTGAEGVVTGSARIAQEAREAERDRERAEQLVRERRAIAASQSRIRAEIAALEAQLALLGQDVTGLDRSERRRVAADGTRTEALARRRMADRQRAAPRSAGR
ncbi:circadian clock protein KaiC [Candidatus Binatia bacterium]|nr:circadian clock protein KaiC [Candidatus Binatia bacterium]